MPDVGIVMPVYKQVPYYLYQAIRSIRKQTYRRFLMVIVIDGVTPKVYRTIKKARGKDKRIKVIIKRENQGVAQALNTGFQYLYGREEIQYLTWVSSDNIYYRNFISELRKGLIESPPNVGLVYSGFRHVNHRGKSIYDQAYMQEFYNWQNQPKENIIQVCFIGASFMYTKEIALATGDYGMEPVEDYDYWIRMTEHCDIHYIPLPLMSYRVNSPYSISSALHTAEQHRRWRNAFQMAKYQGRQRRGIPVETTVIFPVHDQSEQTQRELEEVLNQNYDNFSLVILNTSPDPAVAETLLATIPDPRAEIRQMLSWDKQAAIREVVQTITTPYTFIYQSRSLPVSTLQQLVQTMNAAPDQAICTQSNEDYTQITWYLDHPAIEPYYGELYQTGQLVQTQK